MTNNDEISNSDSPASLRDQEWQQIRDALRGLRFGAVHIIVQDGVIVQIDRTEKRRLRRSSSETTTDVCR